MRVSILVVGLSGNPDLKLGSCKSAPAVSAVRKSYARLTGAAKPAQADSRGKFRPLPEVVLVWGPSVRIGIAVASGTFSRMHVLSRAGCSAAAAARLFSHPNKGRGWQESKRVCSTARAFPAVSRRRGRRVDGWRCQ